MDISCSVFENIFLYRTQQSTCLPIMSAEDENRSGLKCCALFRLPDIGQCSETRYSCLRCLSWTTVWNLCSPLLLIVLRCFCYPAETNFCLLLRSWIRHYFWAVCLLTADHTAVLAWRRHPDYRQCSRSDIYTLLLAVWKTYNSDVMGYV